MAEATVKVRGIGRASGAPDHARITIELKAKSESGEEAFEEVARRSRAFEDLLRDLDIPEEAVHSRNVQLRDEHRYEREQSQEVVAENVLEITVPDKETVGRLITAAIKRTEAHVSGLTWELEPGNALQHEALRKAAEDARTKAEAHAIAMGAQLGPVIEISDYEPRYLEYHDRLGRFSVDEDFGMEPAFKIYEGRVHVDASIEVTFGLDTEKS